MDNNEKHETTGNDCPVCNKHPYLKYILCGLLIFLGAYCAFYTVSDWHFKRMLHRHFAPMAMNKNFEHQMMRDMDKMFVKVRNPFTRTNSAQIIYIERDDDEYKIIIDLRAVDNNPENVQINTNGNILTISGQSIRKSKHNEQISEFQQNYMFGNNVKLSDIKKEVEGNYYIITIPVTSE